ncbi:hypothetical protein LIP_1845 [Limnochorda pilosa]|uniref:Uncharacterized protein n=1 Tax=Limnochorda pilosa TaxID=1555112 RepID=A0A0K2SKQ7_LIMPI|nr:hypothetical protein LIP_1845 [Limnochorda pilosa]
MPFDPGPTDAAAGGTGTTCQLFVPPPSERWLETLADLPRWTAGRLPLQAWRVPPFPPPAPRLPGVRVRLDRIRLEYRENPLFVFRLRWRADLAREETLVLMADAEGQWVEPAVPVPAAAGPSPAPGARGQTYGLHRLLERALEALPRWAEEPGRSFRRGVHERRQLEEQRLEAYYRGLEDEAAEPLRAMLLQLEGLRARLLLPGASTRGVPAEVEERLRALREDLAEARARLVRERRRRMAEVAERYRVRLEAEPVGAALLWTPHLVLQLTVRPERGRGEAEPLELEAAWNLAQRRWSGLACQECGREVDRLLLCRCPRLLCPGCASPCACGTAFCPRCAAGSCAACGRPTCAACGSAMPAGPSDSAAPGRAVPARACPDCAALSDELLPSLDPIVPASGLTRPRATPGGR